jgi:hypothetical protein
VPGSEAAGQRQHAHAGAHVVGEAGHVRLEGGDVGRVGLEREHPLERGTRAGEQRAQRVAVVGAAVHHHLRVAAVGEQIVGEVLRARVGVGQPVEVGVQPPAHLRHVLLARPVVAEQGERGPHLVALASTWCGRSWQ